MRKVLFLIACAVLLAPASPSAFAQSDAQAGNVNEKKPSKWSFGAMTEGRHNFSPKNTYEFTGDHDYWKNADFAVAFKAGYKSDKFNASLIVKGTGEKHNVFTETDEIRGIDIEYDDYSKAIWKKGYSDARDSTLKYNINFNLNWTISPKDDFSFKYTREASRKKGMTGNSLYDATNDIILHMGFEGLLNKLYFDNFLVNYSHSFPNKSLFKSTIEINNRFSHNFSEWSVSENEDYPKSYTTEPIRRDLDFKANLRYENRQFAGVKNLTAIFGMRADSHKDKDDLTSLIYLPDGKTEEDTTFRRHVIFTSVGWGPYAEGNWKYKRFELMANLHLQFYNRIMSESKQDAISSWSEPQMIINSKAGWQISKQHSLTLTYKRNATRPSYDQLNPFTLPGKKSDEIIVGDPHLQSTVANIPELAYTFRWKMLTANFGTEGRLAHNEIESLIKIDSTKNMKTRTWTNSASSKTLTIKGAVQWKGKKLNASISGNYKFYQATLRSGKSVPDRNYTIKSDVAYHFPWDMTISADISYSSPKKKAYTEISDYYVLNARVEQWFGNLKIWMAGLDLLDRQVNTYTSNEEMTFISVAENHLYRRKLLVGISYNF